jgi:hypothetical protein
MTMNNFVKWMVGVQKELNDENVNPTRIGLATKIADLRNQAAKGEFRNAYDEDIVVENRELAGLIFLACAENWLGFLAEQEGREKDAKRHFSQYEMTMADVNKAGRFSDRERELAVAIMD